MVEALNDDAYLLHPVGRVDLEALDGTPILDVKAVLGAADER
ncbi:hypothetical protein [Micromonospora sp. CPCC 205558]